jgi:integrase
MGVYKNKKDGAYWVDYRHLGKRYRKKVGKSKRQAEVVYGKIKLQIAENKYLDVKKNQNIMLPEFLDFYLRDYSYINNKPSTHYRNTRICKNLIRHFGNIHLYEITDVDIDNYKKARRERGIKLATINRELALLKAAFNKARQWKVLQTTIPEIKLFKVDNTRVRYLTEEEYHKLVDISPEPLKSIMVVAVNTGMRRGELLSLKWQDVDIKERIITLRDTKSKETRYIPVNNVVTDILIGMNAVLGCEYVFAGKEGKSHISESYVSHLFEKIVKEAGIKDFHYHDLRHTFASWLVMKGIDLKTVQELLGHKTFNMTLRYSHLSPEHKKLAVEILEEKSKIRGSNFDREGIEMGVQDATNGHLLDTKSD